MSITSKVWEWMKGKRTYICAAGYIAVNIAGSLDVIPPKTATVVADILLALGGASLRAAIGKKDVKPTPTPK